MLDVCHCKGVIFMGSESLKKIVAIAHRRKFGTPAATATTAAPKISTAKA